MAKLYFRYGVMGSSKTANALMVRYNYQEKGKWAWLIKPAIDTRDDSVDENGIRTTMVRSRIGLSAVADVIDENDDIIEMLKERQKEHDVAAIIVDEAQFLSTQNAEALKYISEVLDIVVICYGLLTDFQTHLFSGSKRLIELASEIERIRHICKCGEGAQVNARLDPMGNIVTEGDQVEIGGNERYEAMCWKCWNSKIHNQKEG